MAAKDSTGDRKRSRVGSLLRSAGGAVGAVGRATGLARGEQSSAEEAPAMKAAPAKKTTVTNAVSKKAAPAKKTAKKTVASAKKTTAPRKSSSPSTTKLTPSTKRAQVKKTPGAEAPSSLAVRDDESPWTAVELAQVRAELSADVDRLEGELKAIEADIAGLITDSTSGAGDDQADLGSKAYDREAEYNLAQNSRKSLEQAQRALARIDDGTYGICENCGKAIGKERLQAFPRATLCMQCKQQQEKRH